MEQDFCKAFQLHSANAYEVTMLNTHYHHLHLHQCHPLPGQACPECDPDYQVD